MIPVLHLNREMDILLVQPEFPRPIKSKNNHSRIPSALLKIGAYHIARGDKVKLLHGLKPAPFKPDKIMITSLFTYWSEYVHQASAYYHSHYPASVIEIGGVYATLMPEDCKKRSPFACVLPGLYEDGAADSLQPAYELLQDHVDFQIIHASRGCPFRCAYCAAWRIEKDTVFKISLRDEIVKRKLIFYDNNFLANPNIPSILDEIAGYRMPGGNRLWCECQSGLDKRILKMETAKMLKKANFHNPRLAWDEPYSNWKKVKNSIDMLKSAGYRKTEIQVFMLYNYEVPYSEMRRKLEACRKWGVLVADCRYRPLDSTVDGYNPRKTRQDAGEYFINDVWTDRQVRAFRKAVRRQNIALFLKLPNGRYIEGCERGYVPAS